MGTVMTVRGEIDGEDLGIVDYHEHLYFDAPDWLLREDGDFRLNCVERSAEELRSWARGRHRRHRGACRPLPSIRRSDQPRRPGTRT